MQDDLNKIEQLGGELSAETVTMESNLQELEGRIEDLAVHVRVSVQLGDLKIDRKRVGRDGHVDSKTDRGQTWGLFGKRTFKRIVGRETVEEERWVGLNKFSRQERAKLLQWLPNLVRAWKEEIQSILSETKKGNEEAQKALDELPSIPYK